MNDNINYSDIKYTNKNNRDGTRFNSTVQLPSKTTFPRLTALRKQYDQTVGGCINYLFDKWSDDLSFETIVHKSDNPEDRHTTCIQFQSFKMYNDLKSSASQNSEKSLVTIGEILDTLVTLEEEEVKKRKPESREYSRWEKICFIFADEFGKEFTTTEIINRIIERFPKTEKGSLQPSDFCYNLINKSNDPRKNKPYNPFFKQLKRGQFKVLGKNHKYTGEIFMGDEVIGEWKAGESDFFEIIEK
jgi:hypothetical protein